MKFIKFVLIVIIGGGLPRVMVGVHPCGWNGCTIRLDMEVIASKEVP